MDKKSTEVKRYPDANDPILERIYSNPDWTLHVDWPGGMSPQFANQVRSEIDGIVLNFGSRLQRIEFRNKIKLPRDSECLSNPEKVRRKLQKALRQANRVTLAIDELEKALAEI